MLSLNNLSNEEKQFVLHIEDLITLSGKRFKPCFSCFLNERQAEIVRTILNMAGVDSYSFWGGYEGASRVIFGVYPDYFDFSDIDFPLVQLNISYRQADSITHRDILGSLMGLGIKRETVGDIVIEQGLASFFVKSELSDYVTSQITKIGRIGVSFCDKSVDFEASAQSFEERTAVVSSLRIDSIVSAAANISRGKAQTVIASGLTAKNYETVYNTDCKVNSGDKISVRGYGKFTVEFDGSVSKKGKHRILLKQFR